MPLQWFAVKTVYRSSVRGKPAGTDQDYDGEATLVEERVVVLRATDHNDAIRRGEREASQYVSPRYVNPYGQSVVTRYLKAIESFELFDDPDDLREVWSSTRIIPKTIGDRDVVNIFFGPTIKAERRRRKKYMNREFSRTVKKAGRRSR